MGRLDLFGSFPAGEDADEVGVFDVTVGFDQLAGELFEMWTANGIHALLHRYRSRFSLLYCFSESSRVAQIKRGGKSAA